MNMNLNFELNDNVVVLLGMHVWFDFVVQGQIFFIIKYRTLRDISAFDHIKKMVLSLTVSVHV